MNNLLCKGLPYYGTVLPIVLEGYNIIKDEPLNIRLHPTKSNREGYVCESPVGAAQKNRLDLRHEDPEKEVHR
jgi:hypothetical protein